MKNIQFKCTAAAVLVSSCVWLSGCASTPPSGNQEISRDGSMTKEKILTQGDVKGHTPVVFAKSQDEVRQAAMRALTFVGCKIKIQQPYFLSGERPRKFGLVVGSGGETVNVYLYPQSENETHIWVETHKSFVGLAGQQGWNKQVIDQMTELLNSNLTTK